MIRKVCLLVGQLSSGGAEKVGANMSISLSKKGYDVTVVTMTNFIDYKYEGQLYNFGVIKEKYNRLQAFLKFRKFFKNNKFDVVIDHRTRDNFFKELLFSRFVFQNCSIVYCVHNFRLEYYFSFLSFPWLSLLPHVKIRAFVCVSKEIQNQLMKKLNVASKTIYNFISEYDLLTSIEDNQFENKNYIIGVGRLTTIKQFDKLINAYYHSELLKKGILLFILGDGPEKENLAHLISKLKLEEFVRILPFRKNPYTLIKNAKALVLTSKVEGFPMVLLEAVSLKTPVVSFNCKSGPNELIKHEFNGLLVEDQNEKQLSLALNKLLLNDLYYAAIKANMEISLDQFSEEKNIQAWINLFENQM
jgi:N-acetylgalactosamine-N,N'-diacetylbacillosaminyl-diphospho-undecaprenol 4-alpha-N-acetylgalactosaminyltransferase